ncbi:MAG: Rab family GTPase [Candidatus Wukongarchaeota archaeon]|nr:Rab family GTPase [Candidatus Wukongarchaeota archaeon]
METKTNIQSRRSVLLFKVVVVGQGGVGKTSLARRFCEGKFSTSYQPTLGLDLFSKNLTIGDQKIKLLIWDTGGQEKLGQLRPYWYRGATGGVLVFSLCEKNSFYNIEKWLDELKIYTTPGIPTFLVGNKSDLKDQIEVSTVEAEEYVKKRGMEYFETSAKDGTNVEDVFKVLAKRIRENAKI